MEYGRTEWSGFRGASFILKKHNGLVQNLGWCHVPDGKEQLMFCAKTGCGTYSSPQKSIGFRWIYIATNIFYSRIAIVECHCNKEREFMGKF